MTEKNTKSTRVVRKPLHQRGPMQISSGSKQTDFEYRFVNDAGSRIQTFKEAGWELVQDDEIAVGDARVKDADNLGSTKRVLSPDGTASYLMKIKKEWYDEDQRNKEELLKEQEAAMKKDASQGMYGALKMSRD